MCANSFRATITWKLRSVTRLNGCENRTRCDVGHTHTHTPTQLCTRILFAMHLREPTQGRPHPHPTTHGPSTSCRIAQPSISTRHTWPGAVECSRARAHDFIALLDRHTHTHTAPRTLHHVYASSRVGSVRVPKPSTVHVRIFCLFSISTPCIPHAHTHTHGAFSRPNTCTEIYRRV